MNRADARDVYLTMLAIWPAAKTTNGPDTANLWIGELELHQAEHAQTALNQLRLSADWFPSIAQFHSSAVDARKADAERITPALTGPIDQSGFSRMRELVGWLKQPREPITAKMLDEAGVPNWRERLHSARLDDEKMSTTEHQHKAWAAVRSDFGREALVLPNGAIYPAAEPVR